MFDFRLKVFYVVARRKNFTKAAEELFITQPAVSKHIHEIEAFYKTKLFERNGTKIKLTQAGTVLLKYAEELMNIYRNIDFDLSSLSKKVQGSFHIGASTTVAHYFLPVQLASFKRKFPEVKISMTSHNTEFIENLLSENKIDVAIVEGQSKRSYLKYTCLVKDKIVLCTNRNNPYINKPAISIQDLLKLSLVVREPGSGSLEVLIACLKKNGISMSQLNIEIELESTESIKAYLLNSNAVSFLSVHAISKELKNGELKTVEVKGLDIERCFYFVTQQGDTHHLQELFYKHLNTDNLKL